MTSGTGFNNKTGKNYEKLCRYLFCRCMGRHEGVHVTTPCGGPAMDYLNVCPGVRPVASGSSLAALAPNEDGVGQVSRVESPSQALPCLAA